MKLIQKGWPSCRLCRANAGVTLIELMVTLIVIAIIASFAIPGFQTLIEENRLAGQTNNLISAVKMARSEAVREAGPVTLSAESGDFAEGWCVYSGTVGDDCDDDSRIRQFEASSQVVWTDNGDTAFQFDRRGRREDPDPASGDVTIELAPPDADSCDERRRFITVSNAGRASAKREECS